MKSGFAEVNGTRLFYEEAGSGAPLVLIHGHTLDRRMWDDQFEFFARRYRVIRYDLRGYGRSALPAREPYYPVEDLKALLDHLVAPPAHVMGLSKGGIVAIDFALANPEMTRSLIAVDPGLTGYSLDPAYRAGLDDVRRTAQEAGVAAARAATLKRPSFAIAAEQPALAARLAQILEDHSGYFWLNSGPEERRVAPPAAGRLEDINVPTLAIVGERDAPDFHTITDLLAQRIPNARKVVIPGAGHLPNMEAPERFNEIVRSFLAEVSP